MMGKGILDLRIIGQNLRHMRTAQGLTQKELAHIVHCSSQYISRLEHGSCEMSVQIFIRLCAALHCKPSELLAGAE